MSTPDRRDRVRQLAQRFSHEGSGDWLSAPKPVSRQRRRHSVYIDSRLMLRVDETLKRIQHEAFPTQVNKSIFLEKLLEHGLNDVDAVVGEIVEELRAEARPR
jgi:hypothetical protein